MDRDSMGGDERRDDEVPDLPDSWGSTAAPQDCSALAEEAAIARTALRRQRRKARTRRALRLPIPVDSPRVPASAWRPVHASAWRWRGPAPPIGAAMAIGRPPGCGRGSKAQAGGTRGEGLARPVLILAAAALVLIACVITLGMPALRDPRPSAAGSTGSAMAQRLRLTDATGASVPLNEISPAVLLFIPGCDCEGLIASIAAAVPEGVTVAAVSVDRIPGAADQPTPTWSVGAHRGPRVLRLADRSDSLRAQLPQLRNLTGPAAVFAGAGGVVLTVVPSASTVEDLIPAMTRLS